MPQAQTVKILLCCKRMHAFISPTPPRCGGWWWWWWWWRGLLYFPRCWSLMLLNAPVNIHTHTMLGVFRCFQIGTYICGKISHSHVVQYAFRPHESLNCIIWKRRRSSDSRSHIQAFLHNECQNGDPEGCRSANFTVESQMACMTIKRMRCWHDIFRWNRFAVSEMRGAYFSLANMQSCIWMTFSKISTTIKW